MGPLLQFGENVARLRIAKRLSQTQLAFGLDPITKGISQSYISQLEAGKRNPKLLTLIAIADALDVPVSELLAGCKASNLD